MWWVWFLIILRKALRLWSKISLPIVGIKHEIREIRTLIEINQASINTYRNEINKQKTRKSDK
jgi:hypothetical protein